MAQAQNLEAGPALALRVDAADLLPLGWVAACPALSAVLPPLAPPAPIAPASAQVPPEQRAVQDGYDSDATVVPDAPDTEQPSCAVDGASAILQPSQAPAGVPRSDAVSGPMAPDTAAAPAWLPAALARLQSTAVVCGEYADGTPVVGRRVAFALLGEVTVGELALSEGLHVGRCTLLLIPLLVNTAVGGGEVPHGGETAGLTRCDTVRGQYRPCRLA